MEKKYPLILMTFFCILVFAGISLVLGQYCDSNSDCWDAWDVGDGGDYPTIAGYCTRLRDRCNIRLNQCRGNPTYIDRIESCSGDTLTEYYASGYPTHSCLSKTYNCDSYSQCAIVMCFNPPCDPCPGNGCRYSEGSCKGAGTIADPSKCGRDYVDLDSSSGYCNDCENDRGWDVNWRKCGESFGDCTAGQDGCCGDDNNENRLSRDCSSGCSSSSGDKACCNNANDCVYSSTCYSEGDYCAPWNTDHVGRCSSGTWSLVENCNQKASYDYEYSSEGPTCPDVKGASTYFTKETVRDYSGCTNAVCDHIDYEDYCTSGNDVREYCVLNSGETSYTTYDKDCDDFNKCSGSCPGCTYEEYYCSGGACDYSNEDPDSSQTYCDTCVGSGYWNLGGDVASTTCCGDDASEHYRTREIYDATESDGLGFGGDSNDRACCDAATDCVYNGVCYTGGNYYDLNGDGLNEALCYSSNGRWISTDYHTSYCTANNYQWNVGSGDANIDNAYNPTYSGYDWPVGCKGHPNYASTMCCCGDDSGENYRTREAGTDSTYASDPNDKACCSESSKCVYSSTCFNGGSTGGSIPDKNYCNAGTWEGGDAGNTQCTAIVGSGYWNLGGDVASTTCCGDDASENKRTCQDGGEGACAESTDDEACCSDSNDCVYNNACYSNTEIANNLWICNQGTWRRLSVTVMVIATPDSVKTTWQSESATAEVSCTPDSPAIQCDPTSYALYTSSTSISSCSTTYSDYTLSDPQTISSHVWVCAAAQDTFGTEGFSDPVEFLVDQINPTASLNSLPVWTTQSSVTVGWSGSDTGGSGLWRFDLHYRITDIYGSVLQDWTWWANPTSNPGSLTFSDMQNNRTYQFRIRARDNAGNIGGWSASESISVDLVDPTCDVADLPIYTTSSSFIVSWSGSDGESGIQYYNIQVRVGESGTWGYLNDPDGYHTTNTSDNVNGADGNTYFFRCNATDVAGNEGVWSAVKNTTVDATPPISSVDPLPEWLNVTNFTVSWSGNDGGGSGIDCYDINWSDGSGWNDWFTCTQTLSSMFGPDSPVNVTEGVTYSFSSRATDVAGNVENWPPQPDAYTTIDLTPPQYDLRAYDQGGREISGFVQNVDTVTIRSNTTDSTSGVANNYINYILLNDVGETTGSQDCGSASPYGGISECNITIDFAGAITLEFWVKVIDRAGNMVISDVLYIGTHPLVNFREHNVYMSIGETTIMGIQVRNMQNQADNVTITLSSNLPVAPYFIWVDDPDVEITGNNQTLVVRNLNPGATPPPFHVMVWSPDETRNYRVTLNASSALDITDSDDAVVQVGYPASFPGLNEWAILILIIVAVFGYVGLGKEMH